jgi:hypothetical protein
MSLAISITITDSDGASATVLASAAISGVAAQFPTLMDAYGARMSPHQIPGVDYYVGCPTDITLKDPTTISTGASDANGISRSGKRIFIDANGKLDGYDFRLGGGGWWCQVTNANCTISRCYIVNSNRGGAPIGADSGGTNLTFSQVTLDGLRTFVTNETADWQGFQGGVASGITVDQCDVKGWNQHGFQLGGGAISITRNLFHDFHFYDLPQMPHCDFFVCNNNLSRTSIYVHDNLFYPTEPDAASLPFNTFSSDFGPWGGQHNNVDCQFNTYLAPNLINGTPANYFIQASLRSIGNGGYATDAINGVVRNNYFDLTHSLGAFYPPASGQPTNPNQAIVYGGAGAENINLVTRLPI